MTSLRLGISPCPNDVYIFSGLILNRIPTGEFALIVDYQDVENLNQASQRGEFDLVKISYANYPRITADYDLLDCGGALGRGVGPLLLANGGTFDPEREILIPGQFTTANFLLDFYLDRPAPKRVMTFDVLYEHLLQNPGAQGVVIHEKRFTYVRDGLTLITDLGEHWEQMTGCPIPLGAIALHKKWAAHRTEIEDWVRQSLGWAYVHDAEAFALCQQHAQDLNEAVIRAHIALYVNAYSEDLGEEGRAAVNYFLERVA